ncbi:MAG: lactate utilization protein [Candidatus Doudnabacteria bacterium]|nr:lactate utilization protein [Candidatus Doudnabacteria bacterium]
MFDTIASDEILSRTAAALTANGMEALIVDSGAAAKQKLFEMIPPGAQVMNNTSITLDTIGVVDELLNSGKYNATRHKLMDANISPKEKAILGALSEWTIGSAHAVTEQGSIMIASNTGSQLPSDAYTSPNVILVIGGQKIVKDLDQGMKRIYEYVLPKESVRSNKAYNITSGSFVSKLLVINREIKPNRIRVILVKESLGF